MAITPQSNLRLLKVPFQLDYKNQLTFSNINNQKNYFLGLPCLEINDIQYQRKNSVIRYPAHIDTIIQYNYCMYQNENYTNKYFYAFILDMKYINDGMTEITIQTDCFQTWQFELNFKECFVEREMVNVSDDIAGNYLVPEGLEFGELKINSVANINCLKPIYIIAYSGNPYDDELDDNPLSGRQGVNVNGVFSGLFYCICSANMIEGMLYTINDKGFGSRVVAIFSIPALALVGFNNWTLSDITSGDILWWITQNFKANPITVNLNNKPNSLDGYTPRNQKLRTYPYCYLGFNPPNGNQKIFRYENFNSNPSFKFISEINPNPSICVIPQNYRGKSGNNINDMSIISGYPQISWVTDYFSNWLAQNSDIIKLQMEQEEYNYKIDAYKTGFDMASGIVGIANDGANGTGSLTGGFSKLGNNALNLASLDKNHEFYVKNQMAQIEKQQMLPNSAQLGTSATLLGYDLLDDAIFTSYTIKSEFARKIDKYFDMYGYLINERKVPKLMNRPNWNYVKTIGCNIIADIPQMDLAIIKNMFDNGVTLWHNANTFLDYSQNNRS